MSCKTHDARKHPRGLPASGWLGDRYRYVIELGRGLPPLPEAARTEVNRVRGCASQVWLATEVNGVTAGAESCLIFKGDSDAHIVRGLFAIYSGRCADEIVRIDAQGVFGVSGWPST